MAHSGQEDVGDGAGPDPWPFDPPATPLREGNGFAAFSADGHEYVIDLAPGQATPAPWSNVLANPRVGCGAPESQTGKTRSAERVVGEERASTCRSRWAQLQQ